MPAPAHADLPPHDRTAFALLMAVALSLAVVTGWSLSGTASGELQAMLRALGFGRTAAMEAAQHAQAASIARLEQAMQVVVNDVATINLRDMVSRNDAVLETRLGKVDEAIESLKARVAAGGSAADAWRGPVGRVDASMARNGIEIDALRTSIDAQQQSYRSNFAAMAKRIDRIETLMAGRDVTSAIRPAPVRPKARHRQQAQPNPGPRSRSGWTITHAEPGFAVVTSPEGTFAAAPGYLLPSLGRVTEVRKSDSRWIVGTEKGVIGQ